MVRKERDIYLDLIRGVSALIVLIGHLRAALFVDYGSKDDGSLIQMVFYFLTSLGHQAVMIFFVLSGYFVGGSILRSRENFSVLKYIVARLARLWTPLIPVLIFTLLVDSVTRHISNDVLTGEGYNILSSGPKLGEYSSSWGTLISNIFFLQTICFPVMGSNSPLWSLANEFWYYILFPLVLFSTGVIRSSIGKFTAILASILVCLLLGEKLEGFIIWTMGAGVFHLSKKIKLGIDRVHIIFFVNIFIVFMINSRLSFMGEVISYMSDYLVGFSFSLVLIKIVRKKRSFNFNKIFVSVIRFLSEISYTLYICHFPLIMLLYASNFRKCQLEFNLLNLFIFGFWVGALVVVATLLWFCFEKRTDRIKSIIVRRIKFL